MPGCRHLDSYGGDYDGGGRYSSSGVSYSGGGDYGSGGLMPGHRHHDSCYETWKYVTKTIVTR